jgi:hypothetical protein
MRWLTLQIMNIKILMMLITMSLSWFVAFAFNLIIIHTLLKRWKSWEEMNETEQSSIFRTFSLGVFPGILVWWILGSGGLIGEPIYGLFTLPVILFWAVILILSAATGGALVVRRLGNQLNKQSM